MVIDNSAHAIFRFEIVALLTIFPFLLVRRFVQPCLSSGRQVVPQNLARLAIPLARPEPFVTVGVGRTLGQVNP